MKIEQVIALHLLNNQKVTLQGIGTFRLDPSVSLPPDIEKDVVIPENAVSFEYNPRATEDDLLINSIVKHTTKIKPLASADLDSFLMLGRQFLNIGKPFILEKLGTLDKAQTGELIFIPGQFITPKIEAPKALKENENEESSGLFNDYNREPENDNRRTFLIAAAIVIAALGAWAIYHFISAKNPVEELSATAAQQQIIIADSTPVKKDTSPNTFTAQTNKQDSNVVNNTSFNIVIWQTNNKKEAISYFNRLKRRGHNVVMSATEDSVSFKLAETIDLPLSDTTKIKDSLSQFYHAPVYVEQK